MRFIFLTMDGNHAAALRLAADLLRRDHNVELSLGLYDATRLRSADDWARIEKAYGRTLDAAVRDAIIGAVKEARAPLRGVRHVIREGRPPPRYLWQLLPS